MVRYASGMRYMDPVDQLNLEGWRLPPLPRCHDAHTARGRGLRLSAPRLLAVREGLEAMTEALAPGRPVGEVDDAHRRVLDAAGLEKHRLAACGYSQGTTFQPNWMDWPMLYSGNSILVKPGNVFFLHCIVVDSDRGGR